MEKWRWGEDKRDNVIKARVTDEQKQLIKDRAKNEKMSIAEYIRKVLFGDRNLNNFGKQM